MIHDNLSKFGSSTEISSGMNYIMKKAAIVGGSEAKFDDTSIEDYAGLAVKKFGQINNKFEPKTGRKQEVLAVHSMISFAASDNVTNEQALEIALAVWQEAIGLDNRKHRFAVHDDTEKTHVHLIWNKRDNDGKIYNQKDDYRIIEKLLHEAEIKNGLEIVENRKHLDPSLDTDPKDKNEKRLESRGIESDKSAFKKELSKILDQSLSPSEFLQNVRNNGFTIHHNGQSAYSLTKDETTFKASDVGMSYKTLKARLGGDPSFSQALAVLHEDLPENESYGTMGVNRNRLSSDRKPLGKKSTLHNRFSSVIESDHEDYFFKDSSKKAFEYDRSAGKVSFQNSSALSLKAGIQRLTEDMKTPGPLYFNGSDNFKKNAWLQFHMMNLADKGYEFKGYKPNEKDEDKLKQMREEQDKRFAKKAEVTSVYAQEFNAKSTETKQSINTENSVGKPAVVDSNENEKHKIPSEKLDQPESNKPNDSGSSDKKNDSDHSLFDQILDKSISGKSKNGHSEGGKKQSTTGDGLSAFADWIKSLVGDEDAADEYVPTWEDLLKMEKAIEAHRAQNPSQKKEDILKAALDKSHYEDNKAALEKYGKDGFKTIEDSVSLFEDIKKMNLKNSKGEPLNASKLLEKLEPENTMKRGLSQRSQNENDERSQGMKLKL